MMREHMNAVRGEQEKQLKTTFRSVIITYLEALLYLFIFL